MPNFLLSLSSGDFCWLKEKSLDTGISMTHMVREAISMYRKGEHSCSLVVSGAVISGTMFIVRT